MIRALLLLVLVPASLLAQAQDDPLFEEGNRYVQTTLLLDRAALRERGADGVSSARVGVRFDIQPGWHIYWHNSGESGLPTRVAFRAPASVRVGELRWPAPYKFIERGNITTYGYKNEVLLLADLFLNGEGRASHGQTPLRASVTFLVCREVCVPGGRELELALPPAVAEPSAASPSFELFERYETRVPKTPEQASAALAAPHFGLTSEIAALSSSAIARVRIKNIPGAIVGSFANYVQFFPALSESLNIGEARVAVEGSNFDENGRGDTTLLFELPLSPKPNIPLGRHPISGVFVIAKEVFAGREDLALAWTGEVAVEQRAPSAVQETALALGDPLRYRALSYSETQPGAAPDQSGVSVWFALLSALIAGILLNLMPCVLPVLSLKVLGLVAQADRSRTERIHSSFCYLLGVLTSFLLLAAVLIFLRGIGISAGWGFQFQYPGFVFFLLLVVFVFALSFFEFFTVRLPGTTQAAAALTRHDHSFRRHFADGILATLLATPCTAPFLGVALAFALSQSPIVITFIFLTIGFGLALPYVLIAASPALFRFLPQPGAWMVRFRELLGFLLLGTVVWLLYILARLSPSAVVPTLSLLLFTVFLLWLAPLLAGPSRLRWLSVAALFIGAVYAAWPAHSARVDTAAPAQTAGSAIAWMPFSAARVDEELRQGRTVFIDFTADWCITCKFNEAFTINSTAVTREIARLNIAAIKADWTNNAPDVTEALLGYGGRGVPYYVVLSPQRKEPVVLPTLLTANALLSALREAARSS